MMKDEPRTWFGRLMRRPLSEQIACLVIVVCMVWAIVALATDAPTPQREAVALPAIDTAVPTEQSPELARAEYVRELQAKMVPYIANLARVETLCLDPRLYDLGWHAALAEAIGETQSSAQDIMDIEPPVRFIGSKTVLEAAVSKQMLALTTFESAMASRSAAGIKRAIRMLEESSRIMKEATTASQRDLLRGQ